MKQKMESIILFILVIVIVGLLMYRDFNAQDTRSAMNWVEFEHALSKAYFPAIALQGTTICEWEIIGKDNNTVYVWAICQTITGASKSTPAVVYLNEDGDVLYAETPGPANYSERRKELFPPDIYKQISEHNYVFPSNEHLKQRIRTPGPPLFVLRQTPTP